jgi:hypothetical protein
MTNAQAWVIIEEHGWLIAADSTGLRASKSFDDLTHRTVRADSLQEMARYVVRPR